MFQAGIWPVIFELLELGELEHYSGGVTHVVSFLHVFLSFHMLDFVPIEFVFSFYPLDFLLKAFIQRQEIFLLVDL